MSDGIIRIGVSGWTYAPWRGAFYPQGLKRAQELRYIATQFRTVEVNATFYGLQRQETFASWADQVPADFIFAVKGPRYITHTQRLRNIETPVANFIASGLLRLNMHLGPVLWQLPSNAHFDPVRLEAFLALLPRTTGQAVALGRRHDAHLHGSPWLDAQDDRPMRHALEVRHPSFHCAAFIELLRQNNVALVFADSPGIRTPMDVTADFIYCRLHGSEELYASGYDASPLNLWAGRAKVWAAGKDLEDSYRICGKARPRKRNVFIYFDNIMKTKAPTDALELMRRLRT